MKELTVKFHLDDDGYFTALRLVAGAVCTNFDVDVDSIEDFKVCVTESALLLKNSGFESVECVFGGEGVNCILKGEGKTGKRGATDNEFSLALISALMEECDIERHGSIIDKVTLKLC